METTRAAFFRLRLKYAPLFGETERFYKEMEAAGKPNHGHGWDHDLFVAQYCWLIAPNDHIGELAWVAALLHSIDRHCGKDAGAFISHRLALIAHLLTDTDVLTVLDAAEHHSKKNDPNDSPVLVTLKDADRLANLGPINIFRGGQHRPYIPACILETMGGLHPASTFKEPKSCYDATYYNLEWEEMLRLPKAKEIGKKHFDFIRQFHQLALKQQEEVGLFPYPF